MYDDCPTCGAQVHQIVPLIESGAEYNNRDRSVTLRGMDRVVSWSLKPCEHKVNRVWRNTLSGHTSLSIAVDGDPPPPRSRLAHGLDPRRPCYYIAPHELVNPPVMHSTKMSQEEAEKACLAVNGTHCLHMLDVDRYFCCDCGLGADDRRPESWLLHRLPRVSDFKMLQRGTSGQARSPWWRRVWRRS